MSRNDNPHALRLAEALRGIVGDAAADGFAAGCPLSKTANPEQKIRWAREVCAALDISYDAETVRSIRRACHCNDGKTMAKEIARCIARAGNLPDGCALFTETNRYAFLEYISERELIFGYHACVCSCVKRMPDVLPLTWCECSCGYAEAMFRQIFGEGVQVELLGSVKAGGQRCEIRITIS